jgi:hypothetical protein
MMCYWAALLLHALISALILELILALISALILELILALISALAMASLQAMHHQQPGTLWSAHTHAL